MLSSSRTGAVGMLTLAGWGVLDRRLVRGMRLLLLLSPVVYAVSGLGDERLGGGGDQIVVGRSRLGAAAAATSRRAVRHLVEHARADRVAPLVWVSASASSTSPGR